MKDAVLELNASNDRFVDNDGTSTHHICHCINTCNCVSSLPNRGIDVVRNKIKLFAHQKVTLPPGRHKIVILDEADR